MELYWKALGLVLVAVLLELALKKQQKDYGALLTVAVITMASGAVLQLLKPVQALLQELQQVGNLNPENVELLLKAVGLGFSAEIGSLVCSDGGNEALGRMIRFLGTAAILCLSVPLFSALLSCVVEMVGVP